jgi:surface polysaccharide O-acyltransferase-like enzyme
MHINFVFQNPVATAFEIFWMIFEPILFGLTGTQIKINELDRWTVSIGIACLLAGIVVSIIALYTYDMQRPPTGIVKKKSFPQLHTFSLSALGKGLLWLAQTPSGMSDASVKCSRTAAGCICGVAHTHGNVRFDLERSSVASGEMKS